VGAGFGKLFCFACGARLAQSLGDYMLRQYTANGLDFLGLVRLTLALSVAGFHLYRTYFQMLGDTRWLDFFALAVF
jgi:hypothetical protein